MAHKDLVTVTLVTYNSGRFIKRCLESVLAQKYPLKEVIVVDNASTDGTADILEQFEDRCHIVYNDENIGFAAAQNQAIRLGSGEWVLTLNPDVLLLGGSSRRWSKRATWIPRWVRYAANCSPCAPPSTSRTSRWWIRPASTSRPCCAIWTAAARKWITGIF
jgi:glycosyltransferase involved in cell wall biosynthesis